VPIHSTPRLKLTAVKSLLLLGETFAVGTRTRGLSRRAEEVALKRFRADMANMSFGDFDRQIELLLSNCWMHDRHPWEMLYGTLLKELGLGIGWRTGAPLLAVGRIEQWLDVLNDFDESALLCFHYLDSRPARQLPAFPNEWGIVARVHDFELDRLLDGGAHDLHVHLGGVRQASVAWARAMASPTGWTDFEALSEQFERTVDATWKSVAIQAFEDRHKLCELLGHCMPSARAAWREPDPRALLVEERKILLSGMWRARAERIGYLAKADSRNDLETVLWRYVHARNLFQRCTRQPAFASTPGLAKFDGAYFRATKPANRTRHGSRPIRALPAFRSNLAFANAENVAAMRVLADDSCLKHVELRISPFARSIDYFRFAHHWAVMENTLNKQRRGEGLAPLPGVHFALHFIRTRRAAERRLREIRSDEYVPTTAERLWQDFHRGTSRQTAVLYHAYIDPDPERRRLMRRFRRVDVAGQERDTPLEMFGPHLRLLRGDDCAVRAFDLARSADRHNPVPDVFAHSEEWQRLAMRDLHRVMPHPRPALTVHAGEDFADPLEGLFQIWVAIESCGLEAGEGIGHALALAAPSNTERARGEWERSEKELSRLQHWGSLVWLRLATLRSGIGPEFAAWTILGELIRAADASLYGPGRSEDMIDACFERLYLSDEERLGALTKEHWCAAMSSSEMVYARKRAALYPLVEAVRGQLQDKIIRHGIVIEGNPSSNIRVSGVATLAELPTIALLEQASKGLHVSINTDNPGTFAASIRNEFAVLLQAGRDRGANESELRQALRLALEVGKEGVRFRDH
jgi:hypothetical protein